MKTKTTLAVALPLLLRAAGARAQGVAPAPSEPLPVQERPADPSAPAPLRVGVLGGVGFPRPLAIEGMAVVGGTVALGAEYAALPAVMIGNVETRMWSLSGDLRVFPLRGAFFVGLRAGRQHVSASTTVTVGSFGSAAESLSLDSWFVNPRVGYLWTSGAGLAFGIEAGVQIPVSASVASTLPLTLDPAAQATADFLGKSVIPTVDLLRVGVLM